MVDETGGKVLEILIDEIKDWLKIDIHLNINEWCTTMEILIKMLDYCQNKSTK